jgi:hypothetical protein
MSVSVFMLAPSHAMIELKIAETVLTEYTLQEDDRQFMDTHFPRSISFTQLKAGALAFEQYVRVTGVSPFTLTPAGQQLCMFSFETDDDVDLVVNLDRVVPFGHIFWDVEALTHDLSNQQLWDLAYRADLSWDGFYAMHIPLSEEDLNMEIPHGAACTCATCFQKDVMLFDKPLSSDCPICVDTIQIPYVFCLRGHPCCHSCIQEWWKQRPTCPVCREPKYEMNV